MCEKYGRLYVFTAVMGIDYDCGINKPSCDVTYPVQGICPKGWHVPDRGEWSKLFVDVGGTIYGTNKTLSGQKAANQLWDKEAVKNTETSEEYGFSLLPAGAMSYNNGFGGLYKEADYWTSGLENHSNEGYYNGVNFYVRIVVGDKDAAVMEGSQWNALNAYSVRCVKD